MKDVQTDNKFTEWDEFIEYDWNKIYDKVIQASKIIDGRNILNSKKIEKK